MPVEIKELVIRAVVADSPTTSGRASTRPEDEDERQALIEECVRQVLQVLRRTEER